MIDLTEIHQKKDRPRRIVLYGTGGIGKSTFAACAPKTVFIDVEDGLQDIDTPAVPLITNYGEAVEAIDSLLQKDHGFQTVALDTLDALEPLIWAKVCQDDGKTSIEKVLGGYHKGYTLALDYWRELLGGFSALREKGMTVILLAHAGLEKVTNPSGENYDRYAPRLEKKASALVTEWADEVLFATYQVYTTKDESDKKAKAKGIGNGERLIRTVERPAWVAKNRLDLPEELPLVWGEFAKYIPGTANPTAAKTSETKPKAKAKAKTEVSA
jgi:hypothetical protein